MTVGELKEYLVQYPDNDIIIADIWTQSLLIEMCADALDCEVLDVGMDVVAYAASNAWRFRYINGDIDEAIGKAAHEYMRKLSNKPTDYEADTPLGQQYGDGEEVDQ